MILLHVSLHGQSGAVRVGDAVPVGRLRVRRLLVDGRLSRVGPVGPGNAEGAADVAAAHGRCVAPGNRLANAAQAGLGHREVAGLLGRNACVRKWTEKGQFCFEIVNLLNFFYKN